MPKFEVNEKYKFCEYINEGYPSPTEYVYEYKILRRNYMEVEVEALGEYNFFSSSWDDVNEISEYTTKETLYIYIENGIECIDIPKGKLWAYDKVFNETNIKLIQLCVTCKNEINIEFDIGGPPPKYTLCHRCDNILKPQRGYKEYVKYLGYQPDSRWVSKANGLKRRYEHKEPITEQDKQYEVEEYDIDSNPKLFTCRCGATYRNTGMKEMAHNKTAKHKKWSEKCQKYYAEKERKEREARGETIHHDLF